MKAVMGISAVALLLVGCQTPEEIRAQKAAQDEAWCAEIGITSGDPLYLNCRVTAAQVRVQQEQAKSQRAAAAGAWGAYFLNQSQQMNNSTPAPSIKTTNCRPLGAGVSCTEF